MLVEEQLPDAKPYTIGEIGVGVMELQSGNIVALAVADGNADAILANNTGLVKCSWEFDVSAEYEANVIMMHKGDTALCAVVNEALAEAYENGYYGPWYDEAKAIAEPFPFKYMETIVQYAQTAMEGTYVKDLKLSGDGKLSFTAGIADGAGGDEGPAVLRVLLSASGNGRASGTAFTAQKGEKDTGDGYFVPEDYLENGRYVIADAPLDGWVYDAAPRSLTIVDYRELADSTLEHLRFMQMAHFTLAYKAVMNDGTEGALLSEWACHDLMFRDPMKTFAGGTVTVRILSPDGKTVLFEQSTGIPAAADAGEEAASP
jgi:hypothetical protein